MDAVSLQPAAGAQGELAGMMMVRAYHVTAAVPRRRVLIPASAHGTNPASSALCGYQVTEVPVDDARHARCRRRSRRSWTTSVAALMVTNPNTLGLFEEDIEAIAAVVHERGGLVYIDGANMNALLGVAKPGDMGADVMQFNLHKTFSTPHGGGGPGAGPVAVREVLADYLPVPRLVRGESGSPGRGVSEVVGRVRSFYGNFGMLVRAYAYIDAARRRRHCVEATRMAILNANYLRARLAGAFELPFDGPSMHECVFSRQTLSGTACRRWISPSACSTTGSMRPRSTSRWSSAARS